jgi:hypothetical protein
MSIRALYELFHLKQSWRVAMNKLVSHRNDSTEHSEHTSQEIHNSELLILLSETFKLMYFRADEKYFTKYFRSTISPIKIWQKPKIIHFFSQQRQNEQPMVKVISQIQKQKGESLLQKNRKHWMTSVVFAS